MVPAALDVQGGQVEAGEGHRLRLEQVVRHLAGDELVEVLHGRDDQSAGHLVDRLELHQHFGVEEAVPQQNGRLLLERGVHSREERADERVTEAEGGPGELVEDPRVAVGIVAVVIAFGEEVQPVQVDRIPAEQTGQVLVVHDVVPDGVHDAPRVLEDPLVVPLAVELLKLAGDPVVLAQENGVDDAERRVLRHPRVSGVEAEPGRGLALGQAARLGQQVAAAERRRGGVHPPPGERAETGVLARRLPVHLAEVEEGRVLVHLLAGAEPLLAGQGARERHANRSAGLQVHLREERVVARDRDGPALRVDVRR